MCILVKRSYPLCGHKVEKVIRCTLPFYWYDGRVPPLSDSFPLIEEPFFDCFRCLDEKEQVYSIECPDCTGQGDLHSEADLASETTVVSGRAKDPAAHDSVLRNYHAYMVQYLKWTTAHFVLLWQLAPTVALYRREFNMTKEEAWSAAIENGGRDLWIRNEIVEDSADKFLAEQKCRHDISHPLPDPLGRWDRDETHISEHRPYLNNVSTAIKRALGERIMKEFLINLEIKFFPAVCEGDTREEQLASFESQPHYEAVDSYWERRVRIENPDRPLKVPPPGARRNTPWEFLEYVPPQPKVGVSNIGRLHSLQNRLDHLTSEYVAVIPTDDPRILRGRSNEVYASNDRFRTRTLHLIYEMLASDPGLSEARLMDILPYFDSLRLGEWFELMGNSNLDQEPEQYPSEGDLYNEDLRENLDYLDNHSQIVKLGPNRFWEDFAYEKALRDGKKKVNAQPEEVIETALDRWSEFQKSYLHIVSSVMDSHEGVTQEELDSEMAEGRISDVCGICMEDWDVDGESNYPARIPCGNNHIICLKCFMRNSLEPEPPLTRLEGRKRCPLCRGYIQWGKPPPALTDTLLLWSSTAVHYMYGAVFGRM